MNQRQFTDAKIYQPTLSAKNPWLEQLQNAQNQIQQAQQNQNPSSFANQSQAINAYKQVQQFYQNQPQ
jgi:hypothetical protein